MIHPLNFDKQKEMIINLAGKMSRSNLIAFILSHLQKTDTEEFRIQGDRRDYPNDRPLSCYSSYLQ